MNKYSILFFCLFFMPWYGIAEESSFLAGQMLFRKNCSSCHNVHKELTGPMLGSITKKKDEEWLISFIKNSQRVILSGDPYARFLYSQYNRTVMPSFEHLSEKEIKNILSYIESESKVIQARPENERFNDMPGKKLFKNHCQTCHQFNSEDYGPSLGSIYRRRPTDWIVKFVTNSQTVIKEGDPYTEFMYTKFDKKLMPSFSFLDKQSIIEIIKYIDAESKSSPQVAGVNGNNLVIDSESQGFPSYKFPEEELTKKPVGIFGDIWLCIIAVFTGFILYAVLKALYKELAKSQK